MKNLKILSGISIYATGLFTGLMACFLIVIDRTLPILSGTEYARVMQQLISSADKPPLVPLMVITAVFAPLFTLYFLRHNTSSLAFKYTLVAEIFTLVVLFITVVLNVPINTAITGWSVQNPPADWATVRDQWHTLNLFRTPASGLAFLFHILAAQAMHSQDK